MGKEEPDTVKARCHTPNQVIRKLLVQTTLERTRLVEYALTLPDGQQAAANLLAIADQARAFSAAGGGGLRPFARWLTQSVEIDNPEVDAGRRKSAGTQDSSYRPPRPRARAAPSPRSRRRSRGGSRRTKPGTTPRTLPTGADEGGRTAAQSSTRSRTTSRTV